MKKTFINNEGNDPRDIAESLITLRKSSFNYKQNYNEKSYDMIDSSPCSVEDFTQMSKYWTQARERIDSMCSSVFDSPIIKSLHHPATSDEDYADISSISSASIDECRDKYKEYNEIDKFDRMAIRDILNISNGQHNVAESNQIRKYCIKPIPIISKSIPLQSDTPSMTDVNSSYILNSLQFSREDGYCKTENLFSASLPENKFFSLPQQRSCQYIPDVVKNDNDIKMGIYARHSSFGSLPLTSNSNSNSNNKYIGCYSPISRRQRLDRFLAKRKRRIWTKKVDYGVRKNFADSRLRVKGRFVKKEDEEFLCELMGYT